MTVADRSLASDVDPAFVARVVAEYFEMPGLSLTIDQASRLWGCDAATCRRVADTLVARRVLTWSKGNRLKLVN